ncbi:hypothetical protein TGAM01_v206551 [Trichoderma gamsii]|uniref:Uncharacterized protein n=1 Tax=Trichoderma gamsii TaxID=398673 RepID=A0A2P4ZJZ2_9HYPO|nr:hypothetical protein TGAM01_v206551 [Trichoderma gamsii]PON24621.1 hypothetical protein TGAM01_v206551 [Trichoderma gamsii]
MRKPGLRTAQAALAQARGPKYCVPASAEAPRLASSGQRYWTALLVPTGLLKAVAAQRNGQPHVDTCPGLAGAASTDWELLELARATDSPLAPAVPAELWVLLDSM